MPVKSIDQDSPEYKRGVVVMVLLVSFLGLVGGTFLALEISAAEEAAVARAKKEKGVSVEENTAEEPDREEHKKGKAGGPANGYW